MKLHEAMAAVEVHALCKYKEMLYYAYGLTYTNRLLDKPRLSMQLHDRRASSVMTVDPKDVSVVDWRDSEEKNVKGLLARYERAFAALEA